MRERPFLESVVEGAAVSWLADVGYAFATGEVSAPDGPSPERHTFREVIFAERLTLAVARLNPHLPRDIVQEVVRKVTRNDAPTLIERNRAIHKMLVHGVEVEYRNAGGDIRGDQARLIDFENPENNDWLAINQLTVMEGQHHRRPDIVIFVNGLPLAVIELKNAADEGATIWSAFNQLQTYQEQIPLLFATNVALVISDGAKAHIGTVGAGKEWFKPWRTIEGMTDAPKSLSELQVLLTGVFEKRRFLDLIRHFIVFEEGRDGTVAKKMAGYHQMAAVNVAVAETIRASLPIEPSVPSSMLRETAGRYETGKPGGDPGDRRVGVIWHTQGSGKSLTMAFYAGKVILHPAMANPTVVVITDRNDLDDQLFGTFARCQDLLRQPPVQVESRDDLRAKLQVSGGGVVFTTIQKFFPDGDTTTYPVLSDRRNIVVIADEAHRSQYGFAERVDPKTGERKYGFAKYIRDALPGASFVGFTGTPVELTDRNTKQVFGDYISIYDIERAVADGATVPIYYESRLAKLTLKDAERPKIDPNFEEVTEGEEVDRKEALKSKWAQLEKIVGAEPRVKMIARDLVDHFENRLSAMDGKAMVVCMSRRICVDLYKEIIALRPAWHSDDDDAGAVKVIMTGSASDPLDWQPHIRNKKRREEMAERFRKPQHPFKLVIVRDMWLTGFDAPSMHTMYIDKPMQGHGLMQAIARVNRVFKDKPGGLVVDYLGLADELRQALQTYTESGGKGRPEINQEEAVEALLARYESCSGLFHGFSWAKWTTGTPAERVSLLPAAQEHILALPALGPEGRNDGKKRLLDEVAALSKAFALAMPHERAIAIREDVGFFQAVRAVLAKNDDGDGERKTKEDLDHAIRQIVSQAVASDQVIDIFEAAGLKKPDISILSDQFLSDVRNMPQKNLAIELLRKLLLGEIKTRAKHNVVQSRSFLEMLEQSIRKYSNRAIETAQIIEELIALAKNVREADKRGEELGLTSDEKAFYDALETNDSAVKVMGEPSLVMIARELTETVKKNTSIDWTLRENVQAHLRVLVKRILRKHGYPPDKQARATELVLEQAAVLSEGWVKS
jgi:type I restriction enzyme R subunit